MSSCIIMGKLFVLINGILNNDRLHMINFIYSFGQALTQFLFPFLIELLTRWICFNCTLLVIGAAMFHIIPITLLIMKDKISIQLRQRKGTRKSPIIANPHEESRYSDTSVISFDFGAEIKYPSDVFDMENKWKNPNSFSEDDEMSEKADNFLEDLENHRIMNSEGVEILQTIQEADEDTETRFPDLITIANGELTDKALESIYEEINRKHNQKQQKKRKPSHCSIVNSCICEKFNSTTTSVCRHIINPLRRSFKIFKFYPSVILKSCDIFSYLLFITLILPNLALKQYRFEDRGRVIYLITLMGFCWIVYALLVLKFHNRLKQNCIHYFHIVGLLGKFFGYLCKFSNPFEVQIIHEISFSYKSAIFVQRIHLRTHSYQFGSRELFPSSGDHDKKLLPSEKVVLRSRFYLQLQRIFNLSLLRNFSHSSREPDFCDFLQHFCALQLVRNSCLAVDTL